MRHSSCLRVSGADIPRFPIYFLPIQNWHDVSNRRLLGGGLFHSRPNLSDAERSLAHLTFPEGCLLSQAGPHPISSPGCALLHMGTQIR